jgi:catechol 2,3-dioxygenase-like lactoylglutathione lyase family enzyme
MDARLDHVVLWVADPLAAVDFYQRVVGLAAVRAEEFRSGSAPFPSVRVSTDSIIDLMPRTTAPGDQTAPGAVLSPAHPTAGHPVNHVCLALGREDFDALRGRLERAGVDVPVTLERSFGARGLAPRTCYFQDPDGNVVEARHYD